jgi:hypothetical protein
MSELNKRDPPLKGDNMPRAGEGASSADWGLGSLPEVRVWPAARQPKWHDHAADPAPRSDRIDE